MKKLLFLLPLVALLSGCGNLDLFDTVFTYDTAVTKWPDGTMKTIKIHKWCDYEGEQIQIIGKDGTVYLLSSVNTVLMRTR